MKLSRDDLILYAGAAGLAFIAWKLYTRGIGGAVKDATAGVIGGVFDAVGGAAEGAYEALPDAVKPSSDKNLATRVVNAGVRALPGTSRDETLGTWLYGLFNADPFANDPTIIKRK